MDWHLIETAPRDGAEVLLINDVMQEPVRGFFAPYRIRATGQIADDPQWQTSFGGRLVVPTKWAPLPKDPSP